MIMVRWRKKLLINLRFFSILVGGLLIIPTLFFGSFAIADPSGFSLKWSVTTGMDAYIGPVTKDIDGDGIHEIFLAGRREGTTTGRIICVDGTTGGIIWEVNFTSGATDFHVPCAIADLDNDGNYEIVHTADSRTIARNCEDGSIFWNVAIPSGWHQMVIADIDDNNLPYVYVSDHGGGTQYIRKLYGSNGTVAAEVEHYYSCYGGVSAADLEGDGEIEIFVSDRSTGKGVQCFDSDLNLLWYEDDVWCSSHCIMPVDIDDDGVLEVVVGDQGSAGVENGGIYVLDSDGNKISGKYSSDLDLGVHVSPAIYDIDKDGHLEFVTAYSTSVKVWDLVDWSLDFETSYTHISTPPNFANVMGDSDLEMIVCDAWNGRIRIFNSSYVEQDYINCNAYSTMTQDIDGDDKNEMIVLYKYSLKAYDTLADAPVQEVRTDTPYYSERRTAAAIYVPPISSVTTDTTPPEISDLSILNSDPLDINLYIGWENITCNVTDDTSVNEVNLVISYPDSTIGNISMANIAGTNLYYYNTTFTQYGNYTYYVWVTDTSNNSISSSNTVLSLPPGWDVNNDGECTVLDQVLISNHYGETGSAGWICEDIDNNGQIQVLDFILVSNHYAESWWD